MLTLAKVALYESFDGDLDGWVRMGSPDQGSGMGESDWREIERLLSDLHAIGLGLTTGHYALGVLRHLELEAADDETRRALRRLAAQRATPAPGTVEDADQSPEVPSTRATVAAADSAGTAVPAVGDTPARYSRWTIALHWLMLLLLAAVYACIELREVFPRGSADRELLKTCHFSLGLAVLLLMGPRLADRLRAPAPPITPAPPRWQNVLAKSVHGLLYLFLLGMPLGGWLVLSAAGKPVPLFGLELPPLVGPDRALAHAIEDLHKSVGVAGYWLIGLHAAAALFHHHVVRDDTLRRMLPWTVRP